MNAVPKKYDLPSQERQEAHDDAFRYARARDILQEGLEFISCQESVSPSVIPKVEVALRLLSQNHTNPYTYRPCLNEAYDLLKNVTQNLKKLSNTDELCTKSDRLLANANHIILRDSSATLDEGCSLADMPDENLSSGLPAKCLNLGLKNIAISLKTLSSYMTSGFERDLLESIIRETKLCKSILHGVSDFTSLGSCNEKPFTETGVAYRKKMDKAFTKRRDDFMPYLMPYLKAEGVRRPPRTYNELLDDANFDRKAAGKLPVTRTSAGRYTINYDWENGTTFYDDKMRWQETN